MSERKELSNEVRVLLAFVLSMLVMGVWSYFFAPKTPPTPPQQEQPAVTQPTPTAPGNAATISKAAPGKQAGGSAAEQAKAAPPPAAKAATEEKTFVIENGVYRVEFSNRGGVVKSWQLLKYKDDHKPPRQLDVVIPVAAQQLGAWPLSITLEDAQLEQQVNTALFEVTPAQSTVKAPEEIAFEWSDGRTHVTKRLRFAGSYVMEIETSVARDGQSLPHAIAWRGGFGDATAYAREQNVRIFYRVAGKLEHLEAKNLGQPDHAEQRHRQEGTLTYAGIEDRYFLAAFLPRAFGNGAGLALWHWRIERETIEKEKKEKVPVAEMAAGSTVAGPIALRLFVGPKDLDVLGSQNPPMTELVKYGWDWVEPIARPLFYLLRWIHRYVPNYGDAIILMTVGINMLLYPLKVKSWRSMQKMQKVQPEIQAIKQRYSKYSMRDPRKQQEGQEMMALYKREGINPTGGCLPMILQMPIWISLYQMLGAAIELRHAPWHLWIRDLSSPDPYYILPVTMAITMYIMQKMTPVTTPDPAQQQMMKFMPIMFGAMFVIVPVSSGLVLYILTSNVVGMAQQWHLNKTAPLAPPSRKKDK